MLKVIGIFAVYAYDINSQENIQLEEKLSEAQYTLAGLSDEHQDLQDRAQQQRQDMEQEREVHAQVCIVLYYYICSGTWNSDNTYLTTVKMNCTFRTNTTKI